MAEKQKLDAVKLGIAGAIGWGLLISSTAVGAMLVQTGNGPWGGEFVKVMGSLYVGLEPTPIGALIGLLWGLFDGFLAGFIIGTIYNYLNRR